MARFYQPAPAGAIVACRRRRANLRFTPAHHTRPPPATAEDPALTPSRRQLVDRALAIRRRRARAALIAAEEALAAAEAARAAIAAEVAREQVAAAAGPATLSAAFAPWHAAWRQRLAAAQAVVAAAAAACEGPREELLEVLRLEQGVDALASAAARDAERRAAATAPLLDLLVRPSGEG